MTGSEASPSFRLAYVPGVTPAKWVRIWNERLPDVPLHLVSTPAAEAVGVLREGGVDAGLVRLPVDRTVLSAIPLYTEQTVVVVPKDHIVAAVDEVAVDDLADEIVLHPLDDVLGWERLPGQPAMERPATTADAVELVAAGIGVLVVPQSLARLHHRRDLTYRPLTGAPESSVVLSWPQDETTDLVEQFIGIVRGRTVNSTRGRPQTGEQAKAKGAGRAAGTPAGRSSGRSGGSGKSGSSGRSGNAAKSGKSGTSGKGSRGGTGGAHKSAGRGKPRRRP
ncbi:LysR family substrate-binding domain-containing protein [Streptomyces sp. NPDC127084]|uniref:LysR family substrate-binding domain-containing protein n=1 Tax=Streptomyces sp. NPDC127084 TaxID=3347133 RepID=UPI00365D7946